MSGSIHILSSSLFPIGFSWTSSVCQTFVFLLFLVAHAESIFFNFTHFSYDDPKDISYKNDSVPMNGAIQLTRNTLDGNLLSSVGRASYLQPMRLWDKNANKTTDFSTHFSFNITKLGDNYSNEYKYGDGIAFFLTPFDNSSVYAPADSAGGCLGLMGRHDGTCTVTSKYPIVAVEFDTFKNDWDPGDPRFPGEGHLGIDVNSVISKANSTWNGGVVNGSTANAWITYDSSTKNLSVYLTYDVHPVFNGEPDLSYRIDLRSILPEKVRVGFSSTTGANTELHSILSWDFSSTLADTDTSVPTPLQNHTSPPPSKKSQRKSKVAIICGILAGFSVLAIGSGLMAFMWWQRMSREKRDDKSLDVDDDFDEETGPKRFTYNELRRATNNFPEEQKLGQGGFGEVYRGILTNPHREIAVKKISKDSKQGKKEYKSEVKIISRLRHKNLVQLLGWCHERGQLLLVYEFMPNGSLDSHLYGEKRMTVLQWAVRFKIAQGLASALLYLHEEWEQCVLHRDIKSSNIMLDTDFNAKLGDFGLARLVDHNITSQTTLLAGTLGYLAPEIVDTGKASREADIYSFGVVALEIACGRQPIKSYEEPRKVKMVEWVWNLYGKGHLLEAADIKLEGEFNRQEIECLMMVGLWCCHPDYTHRPSIRQAMNVLNLESPLPSLPSKFPVPIYGSSPTDAESFSMTSSSFGITGSSSGTTNSSSQPVATGSSPLLSENAGSNTNTIYYD